MEGEFEEEEYNEDGCKEEEVYGEKYGGEEESDWSEAPKAKKTRKAKV